MTRRAEEALRSTRVLDGKGGLLRRHEASALLAALKADGLVVVDADALDATVEALEATLSLLDRHHAALAEADVRDLITGARARLRAVTP